jgi:hypothetical protein
LHAVFETGEVITGFEITAKLPKRSDVGHWIATYFPIRDARGRVEQVGVLGAEIVSPAHSEETVTNVNQQLLHKLTLNMDRTQELLLELRRLRGKYGLIRADAERIIDEIKEAGSERGARQEHGSASRRGNSNFSRKGNVQQGDCRHLEYQREDGRDLSGKNLFEASPRFLRQLSAVCHSQ